VTAELPVGPSSLAGKIIIGVDDAPENLALLKAVIEAQGYTFHGAASGRECLAFVACLQPTLILLDMEMPGMNGLEVCRAIRSSASPLAVPVIFLSAHREAEAMRQCFAAGGNDFIVKPFDVIDLLDHIKSWVDRGDAVRAPASISPRA